MGQPWESVITPWHMSLAVGNYPIPQYSVTPSIIICSTSSDTSMSRSLYFRGLELDTTGARTMSRGLRNARIHTRDHGKVITKTNKTMELTIHQCSPCIAVTCQILKKNGLNRGKSWSSMTFLDDLRGHPHDFDSTPIIMGTAQVTIQDYPWIFLG